MTRKYPHVQRPSLGLNMNMKALYQDTISQEAVAFQGGRSKLFNELSARFALLIEGGKWSQLELDKLKLGDLVLKETGLNIDFRLELNLINASAMPPVFDVNNPLLDRFRVYGYDTAESIDEIVVSYRKITSFTKELRGSIDRKNARVTGVFSKFLNTVRIGTGLWDVAKMTPEEVAATTLHEIGHVFTFIETLTQTVTLNMVLGSATQALAKLDKSEQRVELIYETEKALDVKLEDAKGLAESRLSSTTFQALFLKATMDAKLHNATGSSTYDMRSSEFVADQFAARHGAARALFTGLDKLNSALGADHRIASGWWVVVEAMKIALIIIQFIGWPVAAILTYTIILTFSNFEARAYDDPGERFKRIRHDLVQALKDTTLSRTTHERITSDIKFIDEAIVGVNDHRSVMNWIWIALTPGRRRQYSQMRFQQELEQLVNNDLFLKASQLKNLT